jgi:hypothetical protein
MLFPFVRMEFTSSLGPPPGRYPVLPDGAPGTGNDVLLIAVHGAPAPQPLLRRTRRAEAQTPRRELAVQLVTWIRAGQPVQDGEAASRLLAELRPEAERERLIEHALDTVNLAIRAYAVTAVDPFATEVSRFDPREVLIGVGAGKQLDEGTFDEAFTCPPPARGRARVAERLAPDVAVSQALRGGPAPSDSELHLLRALLDADRRRPASAALELRTAVELIRGGLGEGGGGEEAALLARITDVAGGAPSAEEVSSASRELLGRLGRLRRTESSAQSLLS